MTSEAQCAHLTVVPEKGGTFGWWECKDCQCVFLPQAYLERQLAEAKALAETYKREARNYAEALDNIREVLRFKETHYLVMANQVADAINEQKALAARAMDAALAGAANQMLDMVVGSLRGYPDLGGDINVMAEVDRIVAQARREGAAATVADLERLVKAIADFCKIAHGVVYPDLPLGWLSEYILAIKEERKDWLTTRETYVRDCARAAALREGRE